MRLLSSRLPWIAATALATTALATTALVVAPNAWANTSDSPSLDSVVEHCYEALGGAERWRSVETLRLVGNFSTFSSNQPFVMERQRPRLYRFEHQEADRDLTIGFDGERAWWENHTPFSEVDWPARPPLFYALGYEADAEFDYPFLDAAAKGHRAELVGETDFEGIDAFQIDVTLSNGTQESWFVDRDTHLPVGRVAQAGFKDITVELRVFFSDFREVQGLQIPFTVESELGNLFRVLEVETAEVDVPIPADRFQLPIPQAMEPLNPLAGQWRVDAETRFMPMAPWVPEQTTATLESRFDGRLLQETVDYRFAGHPRSVQRQYTFDRFHGTVRVVQIDDLTGHPNLLEGQWDGDKLVVSNLETGTGWQVRGRPQHDRLTLELIDPDTFRVVLERSPDGGQTWFALSRFLYQRLPGAPSEQ